MSRLLSTFSIVAVAAICITACSSSSNSSSASSEAVASPAASEAPAAAGAVALYPGAVETPLPAEAGETPPGGKSYATGDSVDKVKAWYLANVKDAQRKGDTPTGAEYLIGDAKTGTVVLIQASGGKTYILTGPASILTH